MARFGFCAGTYQSESVNADCQRCMNWYPENIESGQGASAVALYPTPGLKRFSGPGTGQITAATLKTLTSHAPGSTPCLSTFSTDPALGSTPAYNYPRYFVQDSSAWTLRTDSTAWNPSTKTWADSPNVLTDITQTVVSLFDAFHYVAGGTVPIKAHYGSNATTDTGHVSSAWLQSESQIYFVISLSAGSHSMVVTAIRTTDARRTDITLTFPNVDSTHSASAMGLIWVNKDYIVAGGLNFNGSSTDYFLFNKSGGTMLMDASNDGGYGAPPIGSLVGGVLDPTGGNKFYALAHGGNLYGMFAYSYHDASAGNILRYCSQSPLIVAHYPSGYLTPPMMDNFGGVYLPSHDDTAGGPAYITTLTGDYALLDINGNPVNNHINQGVFIPQDNTIIWGAEYGYLYKWDINSHRTVGQLNQAWTGFSQYVGADGMIVNGYNLIDPIHMVQVYAGALSNYTGFPYIGDEAGFWHQYDSVTGSLFMMDIAGNTNWLPFPLDFLSTPDVLKIYDIWMDVTYADGSTGQLRPGNFTLVSSTDGSATITNPQNAYDNSPTTFTTITRTRTGGASPPILQLSAFTAGITGSAVRGLYTFQGRTFAVGGNLLELYTDGTSKAWGNISADNNPVTMAGHPNGVIIICAGGNLYAFDMVKNTLTQVAVGMDIFTAVDYCDGYMVALAASSSTVVPVGTKFYISDPTDPTSWNPLDFSGISMYADSALAMLVDHREIWFWGPKRTVVYYDSGNPDFPFEPIPSAFIEQGIIAPWTPVRLDNSVFWVGADERGAIVAWRAQGYLPLRVSTHAVENAWTQYARVDNAIAYSYQDKGHSFWVIYFPTPNTTWVYDTATGQWHERGFWDSAHQQYTAHRSRCHVYAFGNHLVGDWATGSIYQMSTDLLTDDIGDGTPHEIRRFRRAPHIENELDQVYHFKMQLQLETGAGPPLTGGVGGFERQPQVSLRWSNDAGHTWSNEHWKDAGASGEYRKRVIWRRLGKARDRVYEVMVSDPVVWRLVDAHLNTSAHETPIPRYATQIAKMQ